MGALTVNGEHEVQSGMLCVDPRTLQDSGFRCHLQQFVNKQGRNMIAELEVPNVVSHLRLP